MLTNRVNAKMAGIRLDPNAVCSICQQELFQIRKATRTRPPPTVIAFHCSHLYHRSCLEHVCGRFDNKGEGEKIVMRCIRCESGESAEEGMYESNNAMESMVEFNQYSDDE